MTADADVVLLNGDELDRWMGDVIEAAGGDARQRGRLVRGEPGRTRGNLVARANLLEIGHGWPERAVLGIVGLLVLLAALLAAVGGAAWYATRPAAEANWLGYVEAETLYVGAPVAGRLAERPVERGASVAPGAPLFSLDPESTDADTARLAAQAEAAQASAADLADSRQRQPEIGIERALVEFVEQHGGNAGEFGIVEDLARELARLVLHRQAR